MNIVLFSANARIAIAIAAALLVIATVIAIRRGHEAEALMAARNLAPGTRHAIRQAARELPPMPTPARPGPPPAASSGTSSDLPAGMLAVSAPATSGASRHAPSAERPPSILTPSEASAP